MLETTLPNGLKILVQENHAARVVAAQVWVRVGSADELPDEAGLAHVHEHMLFKGTAKRPVGAIAAEIEAAGGDINAWTSYDQTVYHVTMASRELGVGLDVLADAVQRSAFDAAELEKELEVVLEEVSRGKDTPSRAASEQLFSTAYTRHPYARPIIGYVETVKSFTREKILGFYDKWYQPRNMCLVVAGDVRGEDVVARAEQLFERGRDRAAPARPRHAEPPQTALRWARSSKDIEETHLGLAWHTTQLAHEDTAALDVLSVLLGSGESSRLWRGVQRERQLVNECYASSYTPQDPGVLVVGATIHGDRVEEAYRALLEETFRLRHHAPSPSEIEKAKTIILSEAVYQKETVQGMARKLGFFELVAGDCHYEKRYHDAVRGVTPEDVLEVARRYLGPEQLTVSTLLPDRLADRLSEGVTAGLAAEAERAAGGAVGRNVEIGPGEVAKVRLSNGATLLVREDRAVPLVSVRAAAKGGLLAETEATSGITHLAGELLVRGTSRYGAEQLTEELDAMAGGISGVSGKNSLGLRGDFLEERWERGLELFASCLLEATFEPAELERERKTQLEDIASRRDQLASICIEQFGATLWREHPYRLPILGTEASVSGFTREQVMKAARDQLHPEGLVISVVGAVDIPRTIEAVEKRIGAVAPHADARRPEWPAREAPPEAPRAARTVKNREQAHLVIGFPGVDLFDERRWVIEVISSVLGGQGGRLFLELRDKQSLCYSVSAFSQEGLDPGYFAVYIGTAQDKLQTAEAGMRRELEKLAAEGVTAAEVERAKRYLLGAHEIGLQRASARSSTMALNEAYGLGYDEHLRHESKIAPIDVTRVNAVLAELIDFERAVTSIVHAG